MLDGNTFCCLYWSVRVLPRVYRSGAVIPVCFWPHHAICSNDAQASIKVGTPHGFWGPLGSGTVALPTLPSLLDARHSNEKQNLKKIKTKQQNPLHLRLTPSPCSVSSLFFSSSVSKTKIVLMEQFKHTGQLLFEATFFSSLACTKTRTTHTWGICVDCAHVWIDMLRLTGPKQDRGEKYWFFANMAACWSLGHIHFIPQIQGRKKQKSVTLVLPVSMTTRIIQVTGGQSADEKWICVHWNHSRKALYSPCCLSLPASVHHLCSHLFLYHRHHHLCHSALLWSNSKLQHATHFLMPFPPVH